MIGPEFVKSGNFEVDIFGVRYPAQCRLNPPVLPTKVSSIIIDAIFPIPKQ